MGRIALLTIGIGLLAQDLIVDAVAVANRTPEAIQSWRVELNLAVFDDAGTVFAINLPSGQRIAARSLGSTENTGGTSYAAKLVGPQEETDLIMVANGAQVAGVMFLDQHLFLFEPDLDGTRLVEIDLSAFAPCGGALDPPESSGPPPETRLLDDGSTIDVMVVYTPQARAAAGGIGAIEATIQAAVDTTNTAYANSQIDPRLRLVHTQEVAHNDSGNLSTDLSWLASDPSVAALRDAQAADLVSLIVEDGGGSCGVGYVQRNPGPGFAGSAPGDRSRLRRGQSLLRPRIRP